MTTKTIVIIFNDGDHITYKKVKVQDFNFNTHALYVKDGGWDNHHPYGNIITIRIKDDAP